MYVYFGRWQAVCIDALPNYTLLILLGAAGRGERAACSGAAGHWALELHWVAWYTAGLSVGHRVGGRGEGGEGK
jgi:hypothetical protein